MINPISFKGKYVTYFTKDDLRKNPDIFKRLNYEGVQQGATIIKPVNNQGNPIENELGEEIVRISEFIVHDFDDVPLRYFLANRGIDFKEKFSPKTKQTDKNKILSKIVVPEGLDDNYKLIKINAPMLEYIATTQILGNFDPCRKMYLRLYANNAKNWIKKNEKIEAPILRISPVAGNIDIIDDNYASRNYDKCSIKVDFPYIHPYDENRTTYFALRDAGLDEIPVCVDHETYNYCQSFGLISEK